MNPIPAPTPWPRRLGRTAYLCLPATLLLVTHCTSAPRFSDYPPVPPGNEVSIIGPNGQLLSPKASNALMDRLQTPGAPADRLLQDSLLIEAVTGSPLVAGNKVTLLIDGPATYDAMVNAIQGARSTIDFESYIFEADPVGERFSALLLQKQAEGVQVRLIYDSVGSMSTPPAFFQHLRDGGVQVIEFNPINPAKMRGGKWLLNHRDHRKLLVVDGSIAFTGGINISNVYSSILLRTKKKIMAMERQQHAWRDTDVQVEGPGVAEFQKLFLDTWAREQGAQSPKSEFPPLKPAGNELLRVLGSTPGRDNRFTYLMYLAAFTNAESSIHLTTPYFAPDAKILKALRKAAKRGLDVEIILPGASDSAVMSSAGRGYYSALLKSGVKLFERRDDSMLHAKTAVIDQVWSTVGSTNMESLSFLNNDEINAVILSRDFAARMELMFQDDLKQATQIRPEAWSRRPIKERLKEWGAKWIDSLL
jgi:cardiolipin synthase